MARVADIFLLAGLAAVSVAAAPRAEAADEPVPVVVTAKGCEPNELTVTAGNVTFLILNKGTRALEWEILKGVMVVDERENIAPGFRQKLTTRLEPGEYEITCGLLSNPRGRLIVRNADGGMVAAASKPSALDLIGPVAEYRVWLAGALGETAGKADVLSAALASGDATAARAAWLAARAAYLRLAPIAPLVSTASQPLADDFGNIEKALSADPARKEELASLSGRLTSDMAEFQRRARALTPKPGELVAGAIAAADGLAKALAAGGGTDEAGIEQADATLAGIARVVELFGPLTARADSQASARIAAALKAAQAALARKPSPDHAEIAAATAPVPGELTALSAVLGL